MITLIKIIIGSFIISWVYIIYELINAPLCDDDGNIIKDNKIKNQTKK